MRRRSGPCGAQPADDPSESAGEEPDRSTPAGQTRSKRAEWPSDPGRSSRPRCPSARIRAAHDTRTRTSRPHDPAHRQTHPSARIRAAPRHQNSHLPPCDRCGLSADLGRRGALPGDNSTWVTHDRRMSPDPRVRWSAAASRRHGVTSRTEAADLGVTPGQVRSAVARGEWRRAQPGALVSTASPTTWFQLLAIAVVSTVGVASHRAAACLHALDGFAIPFGAVHLPGHMAAPIEVTVLRPRRVDRPGWVVHQTHVLDDQDVTVVNGIRTTTIARTLADLGAVVEDDRVEQALDDALRRGVSPRWIERTLRRLERPGRSGTASLRRIISTADRGGPIPDSMFERLLERGTVDAGLPRPERQVRVVDLVGSTVGILDAAWPELMVGCEAQSDLWHSGPRRGRKDMERHNRLTALGWRMLYASWADASDPLQFTERLRQVRAVPPPAAA